MHLGKRARIEGVRENEGFRGETANPSASALCEEGSAHGDVERVEPAGDEGQGREVPHASRRHEAQRGEAPTVAVGAEVKKRKASRRLELFEDWQKRGRKA